MLEHKSFSSLARFIKVYFEDEHVAGIMGRNEIIDLTAASVEAFAKENPEHKSEAIADLRFLQAEKLGTHEADIEKIKNTFLAILRDIKKDMAENTIPTPTATSEYMQQIRSQLSDPASTKVSAEHIAAAVTGLVGMTGVMDAETATMLQEVVRRILESNT